MDKRLPDKYVNKKYKYIDENLLGKMTELILDGVMLDIRHC